MDDYQYDSNTVKQWLTRYREYEREIDDQIERIDRLEVKRYGVGAQTLSDMPKSPSPSNDRMTSLLAQKEELDTKVRNMICKHENKRKLIEKVVDGLKKAEEKSVIRTRYIDSKSWIEVAEITFGRNEDYEDRQDSYLRRTTKVHGQALKDMAQYISTVSCCDVRQNIQDELS